MTLIIKLFDGTERTKAGLNCGELVSELAAARDTGLMAGFAVRSDTPKWEGEHGR